MKDDEMERAISYTVYEWGWLGRDGAGTG